MATEEETAGSQGSRREREFVCLVANDGPQLSREGMEKGLGVSIKSSGRLQGLSPFWPASLGS